MAHLLFWEHILYANPEADEGSCIGLNKFVFYCEFCKPAEIIDLLLGDCVVTLTIFHLHLPFISEH